MLHSIALAIVVWLFANYLFFEFLMLLKPGELKHKGHEECYRKPDITQ